MKCWRCGKDNATVTRNISNPYTRFFEMPRRKPIRAEHQRCYCDECYDAHMKELKEENELYIKLRRKRLYENALDKLERQKFNFADYEEAIKTVGEYNENNDGKFDSSDEIMAAIILIHNHYHVKPQFKVKPYQVDFLLPDQCVALEIDGDRHKHKKGSDSVRDEQIVRTLEEERGGKWQVIRISTELIESDVKKLPEAIEKVLDYRDTSKIHWRDL